MKGRPSYTFVGVLALAFWAAGASLFAIARNETRQLVDETALAGFSNCRDAVHAEDLLCYKEKYAAYTDVAGTDSAMKSLKEEYKTNPYVASQCHQLAHEIGHRALEKYGTIMEAFKHGDSFCWSGYYHGVVEELVSNAGKGSVETSLDSFCAGVPGKERYSFDYFNCVHGLGHGMMAMTEDDLSESLRLCRKLTGEWEKESCYGGVFMENVMVDVRDHGQADLKPDDLLYPCDVVELPFKQQCYLMQTSYMLSKNGNDFKNVFDLCARADLGFATTCYQSAGRDASGSTLSNPEQAEAICELAPSREAYDNCVVGAVKDIISYHHGDAEARAFCARTKDTNAAALCTEAADQYLKAL